MPFLGEDATHNHSPLQGRYRANLPTDRCGLFHHLTTIETLMAFLLPEVHALVNGGQPGVLILSWPFRSIISVAFRVLPMARVIDSWSQSTSARFLTSSTTGARYRFAVSFWRRRCCHPLHVF